MSGIIDNELNIYCNIDANIIKYITKTCMYSVQCTMYNVQCTVYIVQCTVYNVQCTIYSVHCTHVLWYNHRERTHIPFSYNSVYSCSYGKALYRLLLYTLIH